MNKEIKIEGKLTDWKDSFIKEFGVHFSESELQFALNFIEELLKTEKQNWLKEIKDMVEKVKEISPESNGRFNACNEIITKLKEI